MSLIITCHFIKTCHILYVTFGSFKIDIENVSNWSFVIGGTFWSSLLAKPETKNF